MTIRLPFMDRIKVLSRDLINSKDFSLNRIRSSEAEILRSSTLRKQQRPLSNVYAITLGATATALRVSSRADRLWLANHRNGREAEHTSSNMG